MKSIKKSFLPLLLLMSIGFSEKTFAQESGGGARKDSRAIWLADCNEKIEEAREAWQVEPVSQFPPFFGKKLRNKGYSLPLPFGVGVSFIAIKQTNKLSDFNLIINDEKIPYDLEFYNMVSADYNFTFRPDFWLFPFLNVYGIAGYTRGSVNPTILVPGISFDDPILGPIDIVKPFTLSDEIIYSGTTFGVGGILAGGFKSFFFAIDYNYTWSKMDIISPVLRAQTITPRIGVMLEGFKTLGTGSLYIGGMYLDFKQEITDEVSLREIDPEIADIIGDTLQYNMLLQAKHPLNFLIGGSWTFHPRMTWVVEAGVGDRTQILTSIDFRF